jgi:1,4-alpha-glucan branching enzyme
VKEVNVAGEFNGWDAFATEMKKQEDGTWSVTVPIKKGKQQWKFLVNGNWIQNMEPVVDRIAPKPDGFVSDPYGGKNCENKF